MSYPSYDVYVLQLSELQREVIDHRPTKLQDLAIQPLLELFQPCLHIDLRLFLRGLRAAEHGDQASGGASH